MTVKVDISLQKALTATYLQCPSLTNTLITMKKNKIPSFFGQTTHNKYYYLTTSLLALPIFEASLPKKPFKSYLGFSGKRYIPLSTTKSIVLQVVSSTVYPTLGNSATCITQMKMKIVGQLLQDSPLFLDNFQNTQKNSGEFALLSCFYRYSRNKITYCNYLLIIYKIIYCNFIFLRQSLFEYQPVATLLKQ